MSTSSDVTVVSGQLNSIVTPTGAETSKNGASRALPSENIAAALSYAERGWPVLTLHSLIDGRCTCDNPKCSKSIAKHPVASLFPHGYQDATTDPEEIKFSFSGSHTNIGIATGAKSGIVVLDVDGDGGTDFLIDSYLGFFLSKMNLPYGAVLDGTEQTFVEIAAERGVLGDEAAV